MVEVVKSSNTVVILGLAPTTRDLALDEPRGVEMWSLNQGHSFYSPELMERMTRWFQVHPWEEMVARQKPELQHLEWMKTTSLPVYLEELNPEEVPTGVEYPYQEVCNDLGGTYLTSAIAFMLALAIHEKFELVKILGVDLNSNTEYADQRPCLEYLIGRAVERGIDVWLPPACPLLQGPMYAKSAMVSTSHINRRMGDLINIASSDKDNLQEIQGALKELRGILPQIEKGKSRDGIQERIKQLEAEVQAKDRVYHQIVGSIRMCEELISNALKANGMSALDLTQASDGLVHFAGGNARLYSKPSDDGDVGGSERWWPGNLPPVAQDPEDIAQALYGDVNRSLREKTEV